MRRPNWPRSYDDAMRSRRTMRSNILHTTTYTCDGLRAIIRTLLKKSVLIARRERIVRSGAGPTAQRASSRHGEHKYDMTIHFRYFPKFNCHPCHLSRQTLVQHKIIGYLVQGISPSNIK